MLCDFHLKKSILKMYGQMTYIFHQKYMWYDSHYTHEKISNIISYQGNLN